MSIAAFGESVLFVALRAVVRLEACGEADGRLDGVRMSMGGDGEWPAITGLLIQYQG